MTTKPTSGMADADMLHNDPGYQTALHDLMTGVWDSAERRALMSGAMRAVWYSFNKEPRALVLREQLSEATHRYFARYGRTR